MRIAPNQQKVNFTAIPLHPVKICRIPNGQKMLSCEGVISMLDPKDPQDISNVRNILESWKSHRDLIEKFCKQFFSSDDRLPNEQYLALEIPNGKEKIIAGIERLCPTVDSDATDIHLSYLITNPEFEADNPNRTVKGIGEILLAKAFHVAKESNAYDLDIFSSNDPFYFKTLANAEIKLDESKFPVLQTFGTQSLFTFVREHFDKYIEYCERKYGFKFPSLPGVNQQ